METVEQQLIRILTNTIDKQREELEQVLSRQKFLEQEREFRDSRWQQDADARAKVNAERQRLWALAESNEYEDLAYTMMADERDLYLGVLLLIANGEPDAQALAQKALTVQNANQTQVHLSYVENLERFAKRYAERAKTALDLFNSERGFTDDP